MSYADAARPDHEQPASEARAPAIPSLNNTNSQASSLIDVDSPHVSSVKSDFESQSVQTDTQADRLEREADAKARAASQQASDAKDKLSKEAKKVKSTLKKDGQKISENRDNPVLIGNAILWTVTAAALGYGAYQKHAEGKLDWKLAGSAAGVVGALAVGDYFGSKWLLENKYPPK